MTHLPASPAEILLVEDEPDLLKGLSKALREEGYAVDTADNGEEGLFKAIETGYDAIILDVMLPKLDGFQVLEKLRPKRSTPVLMLTARSRTQDRVRGLDTGADDYLAKPFDLDELLARLRALIRRSAGAASNAIAAGDEVDIQRHRGIPTRATGFVLDRMQNPAQRRWRQWRADAHRGVEVTRAVAVARASRRGAVQDLEVLVQALPGET